MHITLLGVKREEERGKTQTNNNNKNQTITANIQINFHNILFSIRLRFFVSLITPWLIRRFELGNYPSVLFVHEHFFRAVSKFIRISCEQLMHKQLVRRRIPWFTFAIIIVFVCLHSLLLFTPPFEPIPL